MKIIRDGFLLGSTRPEPEDLFQVLVDFGRFPPASEATPCGAQLIEEQHTLNDFLQALSAFLDLP